MVGGARTWGVVAAAACAGSLCGCALLRPIRFTNVSEDRLQVRFYVGEPRGAGRVPARLVSRRAYDLGPGGTVRYRPSGDIVHVQVAVLAPGRQDHPADYWLEVLTRPPVHIIATGDGDTLDFSAGSGELALIPRRELSGGRFEYRIAEAGAGHGGLAPGPR
jgi:hypothetical protein